jgi:hypothetical protein
MRNNNPKQLLLLMKKAKNTDIIKNGNWNHFVVQHVVIAVISYEFEKTLTL